MGFLSPIIFVSDVNLFQINAIFTLIISDGSLLLNFHLITIISDKTKCMKKLFTAILTTDAGTRIQLHTSDWVFLVQKLKLNWFIIVKLTGPAAPEYNRSVGAARRVLYFLIRCCNHVTMLLAPVGLVNQFL